MQSWNKIIEIMNFKLLFPFRFNLHRFMINDTECDDILVWLLLFRHFLFKHFVVDHSKKYARIPRMH